MRADRFVYRVISKDYEVYFPKIDRELVRLGVTGYYSEMRTGGRIYRVAIAETDVLPNKNGPVLPTGRKNGVSFQLGGLPDVENLRGSWRCGDWREVRDEDSA